MSEKCTLTPEERAQVFDRFQNDITPEEELEVNALFTDYLIHRGRAPKKQYHCTKCGTFDAVGWPGLGNGHNVRDYCPQCGAAVTLKAYRYLGRYETLREKHNIAVFRKGVNGELFVSAGVAIRRYVDGEFSGLDPDEVVYPVPVTDFYERRRYYLAPGKVAAWRRWAGPDGSFGIHWLEERTPWEDLKTASEPFPRGSILAPQPDDGLYYIIGRDILPETKLRYSQVESYFDFAWTEPPAAVRDVVSYLVSYCIRPQMEMLVKLDHADVIEEMFMGRGTNRNSRLVDWNASKPHEFFRLSKSDYKAFHESGGSLGKLRLYQQFKGSFKSFEECMRLTGGISSTSLANISASSQLIGHDVRDTLRKVNSEDLNTWIDYINMAIQENLDFDEETVCYPKNLQERHDELSKLMTLNASADEQQRYRRRYASLIKRYQFEYAGLCIVVPANSDEIVAEGKALHHCVGGYAARHMDGRLDILFLRSVEDAGAPLATIEMNGVIMKQIRGAYNDHGTTPAEVRYKYFTDVFLDWVRRGSPRDTAGNPIITAKKVDIA